MKKALALFATILLFSFTAFAQNTASGKCNCNSKIIKGLQLLMLGGSLDYGEIVTTGAAQKPTITPAIRGKISGSRSHS